MKIGPVMTKSEDIITKADVSIVTRSGFLNFMIQVFIEKTIFIFFFCSQTIGSGYR